MRQVRAGALLTTLAVGLAGCASHETSQAVETAAGPAREVHTAEVVRTGIAGVVAVPGTVQARKRAALAARVPASVIELPFREGQWVAGGVVVIRLDDTALRAAVSAAEASVNAAEADLQRTRSLVEQGIVARRELDQVTAAASGARARLTAARDELSYSALRAPFAGRVAARYADVGDVVIPGAPLVEIEGQEGLELRATVESEIAASLLLGARLEALVDGQPQPLAATIVAIAPSADPTTHRFELTADLPAAAGLRAGLFARLLVPGKAAHPRLVVPATAVFERGGLTGLFVVSGGRARLRWMAAGAREGGSVEARAGVEAGERVVLDPAGLADGAFVSEPAR
jgi:RND family efflux transporter MFP subunit